MPTSSLFYMFSLPHQLFLSKKLKIYKKHLTVEMRFDIILLLSKNGTNICESGGIGRRARLRGVW